LKSGRIEEVEDGRKSELTRKVDIPPKLSRNKEAGVSSSVQGVSVWLVF